MQKTKSAVSTSAKKFVDQHALSQLHQDVKPPCKKEEKKEEAKPWVSPEITDEMKTKVHAADPKDKVKTIMGLLRGQKINVPLCI